MKKSLALTLVLVLLLGILASCAPPNSAATPTPDAGNDTPADPAADYPNTNITFIVPYTAGGGTDALARLLAASLETELGKPVVVVNKGGSMGQIGATELYKAKPDGYTIGMLTNTDHAIVLLNGENVEYTFDDFAYIAGCNTSSSVLIASEASGFKTMDEMVAYAKDHPGELTVAVSGPAFILYAKQIEQLLGISVTLVSFDGAGDSVNAVAGGHTDLAILDKKFHTQTTPMGCTTLVSFADVAPDVLEGKVPTMLELGYDYTADLYRMVCAPAGTPQAILDKLEAAMEKVTSDPEFQQKMADINEIYKWRSMEDINETARADYEAIKAILDAQPDLLG
jgi:tripartite-type tricarboxylate transporter receptor subunit TctC